MHAVTGIAGLPTPRRRTIITLISVVALAMGLASAPAHGAEPSDRGLFGSQEPTYDGVDRQSTAILGLVAVGAEVPKRATAWLLRQQCDDGSFTAYRADTTQPCAGPDLTTYTGPNSNSTALAAMALRALASHDPSIKAQARQAMRESVAWLISTQQPDGGWEWLAGLGSDSTSTAMALAAINRPKASTHRLGVAFLGTTMQTGMGCSLTFKQDDPIIDPLSTSWAFLAAQGSLPYPRYRGTRSLSACSGTQPDIAAAGSWLASSLIEGAGQIPSAFDSGQTDWNVTALSTLGMSQSAGSHEAVALGLAALQANVDAYVLENGLDRAAPLGTLLMVAQATRATARDFGGTDLRSRLLKTMRK
jgi:hypothetical protein